ncbi:hypothetical protein, partial [Thiohalomonas denitrificans]|uniref:hypothetical protein n=1 Tax=Thiohalomonas denitrificans TaxID=415747 RepID=UPI0026EF6DBE
KWIPACAGMTVRLRGDDEYPMPRTINRGEQLRIITAKPLRLQRPLLAQSWSPPFKVENVSLTG